MITSESELENSIPDFQQENALFILKPVVTITLRQSYLRVPVLTATGRINMLPATDLLHNTLPLKPLIAEHC